MLKFVYHWDCNKRTDPLITFLARYTLLRRSVFNWQQFCSIGNNWKQLCVILKYYHWVNECVHSSRTTLAVQFIADSEQKSYWILSGPLLCTCARFKFTVWFLEVNESLNWLVSEHESFQPLLFACVALIAGWQLSAHIGAYQFTRAFICRLKRQLNFHYCICLQLIETKQTRSKLNYAHIHAQWHTWNGK